MFTHLDLRRLNPTSFSENFMQFSAVDQNLFEKIMVNGCLLLLATICVLSRARLVGETFIGIKQVPNAVYDTPRWKQLFPRLQLSYRQ